MCCQEELVSGTVIALNFTFVYYFRSTFYFYLLQSYEDIQVTSIVLESFGIGYVLVNLCYKKSDGSFQQNNYYCCEIVKIGKQMKYL